MGMRYRMVAVAATMCCLHYHMLPHACLGPIQVGERMTHPVEMAVATVLSLPLFPARIEERPHPLWLGIAVLPPYEPLVVMPRGHERSVQRMTLHQWMGELAPRVYPGLGDGAGALVGAGRRGATWRFEELPALPAHQEIA